MTEHFAPVAGVPQVLTDDLALVLAPNPSPMTGLGTNTYLLGLERLVVIDPGPECAEHLSALLAAIAGRTVTHILVTHSHLDHAPLAGSLAARTGACVHAFGNSLAGRSAVMAELAHDGLTGGGEGVDHGFAPDHCLRDEDVIQTDCGPIIALHTPGHMGNHMCFVWGDMVFTGDHVMGWASSLVSPPDGDLTDFMASCLRLKSVAARVYYPGHGPPICQPQQRLDWLIAHRHAREGQILSALSQSASTAAQITARVYHDVAPNLRHAAQRNVFAHLVDLCQRGQVIARPQLSADATFAIFQG